MAERRTPSRIRVGPLFIEHWFKKRLPPTPTLQAGFMLRCYGKGEQITRAMGQIVGNLRAAIFTAVDRKGREFPQFSSGRTHESIPCAPWTRRSALSGSPRLRQNLIQRARQLPRSLVVV